MRSKPYETVLYMKSDFDINKKSFNAKDMNVVQQHLVSIRTSGVTKVISGLS